MSKLTAARIKKLLFDGTSWLAVVAITFSGIAILFTQHAKANTRTGQMIMHFKKERYGNFGSNHTMGFSPDSPAATTASGTTSANTFSSASPSKCNSADDTSDKFNQIGATAASTGERCMATFISPKIGKQLLFCASAAGSCTGADSASITGQFYSSESSTQETVTPTVYIYRWSGTGEPATTDRIATLTCADPGTSATSCAPTAVAPAQNVTVNAGEYILAIWTMNITAGSGNGRSVSVYFDCTGTGCSGGATRDSFIKLGYQTWANANANAPATFSGTLDDDFTTGASSTTCTTGGVSYNTKWTCLLGSAASVSGQFNAADTGTPPSNGDSSGWLWLSNQTTATTATTSNFGSTPSNTFLYQSLPNSYGYGDITTVVNADSFYELGSTPTTASSPYNHVGLVLWVSNTDYLEMQVYSDAANGSGDKITINNSGTLDTANAVDVSGAGNAILFNTVWLRFHYSSSGFQPQYSFDGASFTNIGSAISHSTAFTRVGLNAFTKIANPVSTYGGSFEWFQSTLGSPTYNQTSYRWFANANSTTPGSALTTQNLGYTLTSAGQQFRLRQLVHASGTLGTSQNTIATTVDSSGVGQYPSVALGSDGFARIGYYDQTNGHLKFAQCTNLSCSTSNITTVDSNTNVGKNAAIAMGSDGFARIAYYDRGNGAIKFAQCTNAACTTHNLTAVDSTIGANSATYIGLAIASDGFGRIAYLDGNGSRLRFAQCTNAACSTSNINTVGSDSPNDISMTLDSSGNGLISYTIGTNSLIFVQCTNAACSTNNINTVDSTINVGFWTSTTLGSDGFARLSYSIIVSGNAALRFTQCTNAACTTKNSTTVDSAASTNIGTFSSVAMASDGFARISYYNQTGNLLKYAKCTNAACSTNIISSLDTANSAQIADTSLVLTNANAPVIAYYDDNSSQRLRLISPYQQFRLKFASQGSGCSSATYSDVTSSSAIAFYTNSSPKTGDTISYQSGTDPTESGQTVVAEHYLQDTAPFYTTTAWGDSVDAEWDLSLYDNGATASTTYCFKLVNGDGSDFTTYTNYPTITTFGVAGPTTDQVLRGGQWFNNGSKQSFYWAQ